MSPKMTKYEIKTGLNSFLKWFKRCCFFTSPLWEFMPPKVHINYQYERRMNNICAFSSPPLCWPACVTFTLQESEHFRHSHSFNSSATVQPFSAASERLQERALHLCSSFSGFNRALLLSLTARQEPLSLTSLHRPSADLPTAIKTLITRS